MWHGLSWTGSYLPGDWFCHRNRANSFIETITICPLYLTNGNGSFSKLLYQFILHFPIKLKCFLRFVSKKLATYRWLCIFHIFFTFNTVLEIISRTIFLKNKCILFFDGPINIIMLYMDGKLMKRQTIWHITCWNRWRKVLLSFFLTYSAS